MYALIVVAIFVFIVAVIVYLEYRNEKAYQVERKKRKDERKTTKAPYDPKAKVQKPKLDKKEKEANRKASTPGAKEKPKPQNKKKTSDADAYALKDDTKRVKKVPSAKELREAEEQEKLEELKLEELKLEEKRLEVERLEAKRLEDKKPEPEITKTIDLPECNYPEFDYSRLVGMGLSEDEAIEFIKELIPQIETQIPLIQEAMDKEDFYSMERLTHSIKGSSTTVGSGGVSDLLVAYNTYLKTGEEIEVAKEYQKYLKHYYEALKTAYAA